MRLFLLFGFFLFSMTVSSQELQWAKGIRGNWSEYSQYIEVDQNGNSYTLGFTTSWLFELSPSVVSELSYYTEEGGLLSYSGNIFLVKKDINGEHLWSQMLSDVPLSTECYGLKIGSDGYLYIGYVNTKEEGDFFNSYLTILKLDLDGNEVSRSEYINLGSWQNGTLHMTTFDLDHNNDFYIGGYFVGEVQLDLNHPEFDLISSDESYANGYLMKISNSGNILWTKVFEGDGIGSETTVKITSDNNICVLTHGSLFASYNFLKLDSNNGDVIWNREINEEGLLFKDMKTLSNGNVVLLFDGPYWQAVDLDFSDDGTYFSIGQQHIVWYNNSGLYLNSVSYNFDHWIDINNIQVDEHNNTFLLGQFGSNYENALDLDPSENEFNIIPYYFGGGFFIKFDENVSFVTALKINGINNTAPYNSWRGGEDLRDIKVQGENYYITGNYRGNPNFSLSEGVDYFVGNTSWNAVLSTDGYIMKIGSCENIPPTGDPELSFCESETPKVSDLVPNSDSIKWYNSVNSTTPLEDDIPLVDGQMYYASRQIGNCPESSDRLEVLVTINPTSPEPQVPPQNLCYNYDKLISDLNIQGTNLSFYRNLTDVVPMNIATLLLPDTTYYVSQNTTGCESNRVEIPLNLITTPVPNVSQQQSFCLIDNPVLFDIEIQGENIKWYDANQNLLSGNLNLTASETLYVSQTVDGCESELFPVYVTITDTPIPQAETNQVLCIDANPILNDVSVNGENIKWYDENGNLLSPNTPVTENIIVYVTQTIDNCESQEIQINVTLQNSLNTNDFSVYLCDENNNNSENINLSDYNEYLINNGTSQNFTFSYYNSHQNALNSVNPILDFSNYQSSSEIIYVRVSSTTTTCFDISELSIHLIHLPEIPLTENVYYLCGNSYLQLHLTKSENTEYVWFNGNNTTNITIAIEGEYWVKAIKTENGITCESTHHFSVKRTEPIHIAEIKIDDWTENNNTITVLPYNENYIYSLNGQYFQNENYFENLSIGRYTVYVKDRGDCDEFSDVVYLLNYPRFFTPNGDGINDYWRVKFSQFQEAFNVEIYDRYGKLITVFDKNSIGWDGKLNGEDLFATDYWFKITRVSDKKIIYRGHFSLVR